MLARQKGVWRKWG